MGMRILFSHSFMDEQKEEKMIWAGKTSCACGSGCACGGGHMHGCCGWHRGPHVIGWIIGIVLLFVAFFMGVAIGHFSDGLHSMYGDYYYRPYPMMQGGYYYGGCPAQAWPSGSGTSTPANGQ